MFDFFADHDRRGIGSSCVTGKELAPTNESCEHDPLSSTAFICLPTTTVALDVS